MPKQLSVLYTNFTLNVANQENQNQRHEDSVMISIKMTENFRNGTRTMFMNA